MGASYYVLASSISRRKHPGSTHNYLHIIRSAFTPNRLLFAPMGASWVLSSWTSSTGHSAGILINNSIQFFYSPDPYIESTEKVQCAVILGV